MKKRALLSVSDKTGVIDFARRLEALGYELVSTGGTETAIKDAGIAVTNITFITGFPECLDGRLKTLHPVVHGGILAMRDNPAHMSQLDELNIAPIDIVAINLYPFRQTVAKPNVTLEDAIENIDIGGPTMLRAAAKNWQDVAVIVDPSDYDAVAERLESCELDRDTKFSLACKVFEHTAQYDAMITAYLNRQSENIFPDRMTLTFEKAQDLRYGENPHQNAVFYHDITIPKGTISSAIQLHGKELSFNNINDANAAIDIIKEFDLPCAVAVKHANPCGAATGESILQAYKAAHAADPVSIFGGIVALNRPCNLETAGELSKTFLEIVIAQSFDSAALELLREKKNIRLLALEDIAISNTPDMMEYKKVGGGLLIQQVNCESGLENLQVVTNRAPTDEELEALKFGWRVVKHVKSNAIVLSSKDQTLGVGPGQVNRITALELAVKYAGERANGSVMSSDAYFPFRDCVDAAAKAGITAIIQPGGSIRDKESIDACNEHGIAMVFTGIRHFRH